MAHHIKDVIHQDLLARLGDATVVGIDIGSRSGKGVLLAGNQLHTAVVPTGFKTQQTAEAVLGRLLEQADLATEQLDYIVGTGYGRISMEFGGTQHQVLTEISCHAMGAHALNPRTRTIIDIGGQDSKAIKVDTRNGKVLEFVMNDKCAAGTGRFLEKAAQLLDLDLRDLGEAALQADKPSAISSQCVVFSESEVISLRARGERRENIAAGIHHATALRVRNLLNRIGLEPDIVFTGGVSNNVGMKKALEDLLKVTISPTPLDSTFAGALGAAIYAATFHSDNRSIRTGTV
jgi:(R)-2-hydroxyacyl-CoA dehydratese activating ATPase